MGLCFKYNLHKELINRKTIYTRTSTSISIFIYIPKYTSFGCSVLIILIGYYCYF